MSDIEFSKTFFQYYLLPERLHESSDEQVKGDG